MPYTPKHRIKKPVGGPTEAIPGYSMGGTAPKYEQLTLPFPPSESAAPTGRPSRLMQAGVAGAAVAKGVGGLLGANKYGNLDTRRYNASSNEANSMVYGHSDLHRLGGAYAPQTMKQYQQPGNRSAGMSPQFRDLYGGGSGDAVDGNNVAAAPTEAAAGPGPVASMSPVGTVGAGTPHPMHTAQPPDMLHAMNTAGTARGSWWQGADAQHAAATSGINIDGPTRIGSAAPTP